MTPYKQSLQRLKKRMKGQEGKSFNLRAYLIFFLMVELSSSPCKIVEKFHFYALSISSDSLPCFHFRPYKSLQSSVFDNNLLFLFPSLLLQTATPFCTRRISPSLLLCAPHCVIDFLGRTFETKDTVFCKEQKMYFHNDNVVIALGSAEVIREFRGELNRTVYFSCLAQKASFSSSSYPLEREYK